jgi:hypothetical protein
MGIHRTGTDGYVFRTQAHMISLTSLLGYSMAKNLRAKIPAEDTLFIHDVNAAATQKFLEESPKGVRIAKNVREVAENAVSTCPPLIPPAYDETLSFSKFYDLSWGHLWLFP